MFSVKGQVVHILACGPYCLFCNDSTLSCGRKAAIDNAKLMGATSFQYNFILQNWVSWSLPFPALGNVIFIKVTHLPSEFCLVLGIMFG